MEEPIMTDAYKNALSPDDISVGDTSPVVKVEDVGRIDFVKYAGASGDFNPIHISEPYAKQVGEESVFGQGMLTAGIAAHMVADWLGLKNVRTFRTRFVSRLWPDDTVTVSGEVTDKEQKGGETLVEVEFSVETEKETLITGSATASL
jgi:peroxisomal enoyl-CoA hydratase 2